MDLDRLLGDPAYGLPVPPDGLARVNQRAGRIRRRRRVALAAPAIALALLVAPALVGTGADGRAPDVVGVATAPPTPEGDYGRDKVTPVPGEAPAGTRARFIALADRLTDINQANQRLAGQCMRAKGHPYEATTREPREYEELALPAQYGLTAEQAERRGYGIAERLGDSESWDPNAAYLETLTESGRTAWHAALGDGPAATAVSDKPFMRGFSVSLAGCFGDASVELWGGAEEYGVASFILNAPPLVAGMARLDPDMAALNGRWGRCMIRTGHADFESPEDAQGSVAEAYSGDQTAARAREMAVARADAECQTAIGYGPTRTSLEDRYLAGLVEQYPDTVAYVEEVVAAAHRRAGDVLDAA
jgi:hypothetical protein